MNMQEKGEVDVTFGLFDLQSDEHETLAALTSQKGREIRIAPTHGFTQQGEFTGFRLKVQPTDSACSLPVNRTMFHGVSMVEVDGLIDEEREKELLKGGGLHPAALALFFEREGVRTKMEGLMQSIRERAVEGQTATLDCVPVFSSANMANGAHLERLRDSQQWVPDYPVSLGLYHGFVKRPGHQSREHRVFIVCEGGLRQACDHFMNLSLDISMTDATALDMCTSEETWWLRKACSRMRAALLAQCAQTFGLKILTYNDAHAYNPDTTLAQLTTETLHNDMQRLRDGSVALFNSCVDPSTPRNGVIMSVAPSEGFLLCRGADRSSAASRDYGDVFGSQSKCGIFPVKTQTRTPTAADRKIPQRWTVQESFLDPTIVRDTGKGIQHYFKLDETFMRHLESKMQWSRDYGIVELMPITVGVFE